MWFHHTFLYNNPISTNTCLSTITELCSKLGKREKKEEDEEDKLHDSANQCNKKKKIPELRNTEYKEIEMISLQRQL